jgi:hypothetical protein
MAIDSFSTDELNIKDMVIRAPETSTLIHFVPERDITTFQWECGKIELASRSKPENRVNYGELASSMLILFPERREELQLLPFEELKEDLGLPHTRGLSVDELRILYPENVTRELIRTYNGRSFGAYEHLIRNTTQFWKEKSGYAIFEAFVAFPEKFETLKPNANKHIFSEAAQYYNDLGDWYNFASLKLAMKLLGMDPEVTSDEWNGMKTGLEKSSNQMRFMSLAAHMKMLAAKEIKMSPQGLQVIMPEDENQLVDVSPAVPERRKF